LGASTHLTAEDIRWLSPLSLWTGILAGPAAWGLDLQTSYALVHWACASRTLWLLHSVTLVALGIVAVGVVCAWMALQHTAHDTPTDGGMPRQRARFMAILGLSVSALSILTIVAGAFPRWMLDACQ